MNYCEIIDALDTLEELRESIIQTEANDSNRATLDQAYRGVVGAITGLSKLVRSECLTETQPTVNAQ